MSRNCGSSVKTKLQCVLRFRNAALAAVFVALAVAAPLKGATITVTSTADSGPGSLRAAIASASSGDTISFNLPAYPATISLASTLSITTSLTISGPGAANLAISGNNAVQVLYISSGTTVTITGIAIENGSSSSESTGNAALQGGGIHNDGSLTLGQCTLSGSYSDQGGAIANTGSATINETTITGNSAHFWGGGIQSTGTVIITNSTISGNNNAYPGGGIANLGTMKVLNSTISGNTSGYEGGGIANVDVLTVINSTFYGNRSNSGFGGGLSSGGGNVSARAEVAFSTFFGNGTGSNNYAGGAVASLGGSLVLRSTILANSYAIPQLRNSNCYVGSSWAGGPGTLASQGYNLSDDSSCSAYLSQASDNNGSAAGLDPNGLQSNGGPTQTIALTASSPAVDIIPASACTDTSGNLVTTDQRGVPRPQDANCDIGAFELVIPEGNDPGPSITSVTGNISSPVAMGTVSTLTATFTDVGFSSDTYTLTILWDGTNSLTTSTGTPATTVTVANATSGNPTVTAATSGSVGTFGPCTGSYNAANPSFTVNCSYTYPADGVYTIDLSAVDEQGNGVNGPSNPYAYQYAVVYNPNAGFVTGGGWINSPAGACTGFLSSCTPDLAGKANFGFVSRYQKGASLPTGDTQFQFQAGSLNFHSSTYQWLVVAGGMAQYKGSQGTINGSGNYGFLLTACDAEVTGTCAGAGSDTFRIKIWDDATGSVVYDNMLGQTDTATPTTAIGGGAIVIHK